MDRLWAPWRLTYIQHHKKEKGCLFCRINRSKKEDAKNFVFYRSKHAVALLNIYPYNNGHVMIAPLKHIKSLENLDKEELSCLMETLKYTKLILDKIFKPAGYNIGINIGRISGAGIDKHLHIHLVPRWQGDANFMTTVSGTRVISQSLRSLYLKLKKEAR